MSPPVRAGRDALGTLPVRAVRWCDALAAATGYGWWLYPPTDFELLFDGERIWWACSTVFEGWLALEAVQFPNFAAAFDAAAPEHIRGYSPPFLTVLPEAGMVQIWTGLLARTAPNWSLLLKSPANLPALPGAVAFEGIVETDLWAGPLFTNFRITRTNEPVQFRQRMPFLQVAPVPQAAYSDATLESSEIIEGLTSLDEAIWEGWFRDVVEPNQSSSSQPGRYASAVRRRRKQNGQCPFTVSSVSKS